MSIESQDSDTLYCSLGELCHTAEILKKSNRKICSYPFDWIYTTPKMVLTCLKDNFDSLLDKNQFVDPPIVCPNKCGHKIFHEDLFNHRDPRTQEDYDYYLRCADRFRKLLISPKLKIFYIVTYNHENDSKIEQFKNDVLELGGELAKHTTNFRLISVFHKTKQNEHYYQGWNLTNHVGLYVVNTITPSGGVRFGNPSDDAYFEDILMHKI